MNFECADLERAFRSPELMPDARAHAQACTRCREELDLWEQISQAAPALHEEWDSPLLWPRIQTELSAEAEARTDNHRRYSGPRWQLAFAAAALLVITVALFQLQSSLLPHPPDTAVPFIEAEALREVQDAEAAYLRSIEKLSSIAENSLKESASPLAAVYREKLLLLDSAIADLKATVEGNEYNAYLQTQLASLYHDKQTTLEDWLENAKKN